MGDGGAARRRGAAQAAAALLLLAAARGGGVGAGEAEAGEEGEDGVGLGRGT